MARSTVPAVVAIAWAASLAQAQSAAVSLVAPTTSVAPGNAVTVTLVCDYDLAGAGSGVFGAAGFYGFGGDVIASGPAAGDAAADSPLILSALDSGDTATLGSGGALLRAGAGRGLAGGLSDNAISPLSFDVQVDADAAVGSTLTIDFDGAMVLALGDTLTTFATAPGPGQSALATTPLALTIVGACSPADITTTGSANGTPDGVVDLSDFSFYLTLWSASDAQADITTTGSSNGVPDSVVDLSDFSFYLTLWSAGCL